MGVFRIVGTNGVFYLSNQEANGGGLADLSVVFGAGGGGQDIDRRGTESGTI